MNGFVNLACLMKQVSRCHRVVIINAITKSSNSEVQYVDDFDEYLKNSEKDYIKRTTLHIKDKECVIPFRVLTISDIIVKFNDDKNKVQIIKNRYPMSFDGTIFHPGMDIKEWKKHELMINHQTWYNIG